MSVPSTSQIQFVPTGGSFSVDSVTDPGGAPAEVIDVDLGFTVSGTVKLPNWMVGKGHVNVYADELGGPIDKRLVPSYDFDITASVGEPKLKTYKWSIAFPGNVLPDPSPGSQLYRLAAVFTYGDQSTDIAAFVEMGTYLIN